MAEAQFGPDATRLSAPQGAGATPIAPVQRQTSGVDLSGLANVGAAIANMLGASSKQDSEAVKNGILTDLSNKVDGVSAAYKTGQISLDQSKSQIESYYAQYKRTHPELLDEFTKLANFDKNFGSVAPISNEVQTQDTLRRDKLKSLSDQGIYTAGLSKEAETKVIYAADESLRLQKQLTEQRAAAAERRTQTTFDQGQEDRTLKEGVTTALVEIGANNLDAFNSVAASLADDVLNGRRTGIEAQAALQKEYSRIQGTIAAASASHPELSGQFKGLFENAFNTMMPHMKEGNDVEKLKQDVERMKLTSMKSFLSDPVLRRAATVSEVWKNYPDALVKAMPNAQAFLLGKAAPTEGEESLPRIVGNSALEKDTFKSLGGMVSAYNNGKIPGDKGKVKTEINNMLKGTLSEFSDQFKLNKLNPESRGRMFELISNSDIGKYIKENPLDAETKRGLDDVYRSAYQATLDGDLNKRLSQTLGGNVPRGGPPLQAKDMVDITFGPGGLVISPKGEYKARAAEFAGELSRVAAAASKIVYIGAHLEGSTDYQAFWEANKAQLLPSMQYEMPKGKPTGSTKPTGSYTNETDLKNQVAAPAMVPTPASESKQQKLKDIAESLRATTDPKAVEILLQERDKVMKE
jgi:hypothetical protein